MKYALIIGNNKYDDPKLAQLKTPAADSQALAKILGDKTIGSFDEVTPLINQTETRVRRAISAFLTNKKPDDLVLLYFSGHGVLDDRGRLYLALRDTQFDLLKATSIPSSFLADEMDSCRSKRQILILDCCHSGAFARGTKGEQKAITETTFEGSGFGRVVLTASDSTQYALEGDQVIKQTELSLFTHFLLDGLKTGEADMNNDGHVALDEWYDYTYARVISETPRQVPHKWSYNQQGDLIIARNPFVKKKIVELPHELVQALESPFVGIRESAVNELGKYLNSRDPEMVALAISSLKKMREDDSRRISSLAEKRLSEFEQTRMPSTPTRVMSPIATAEIEPEAINVTDKSSSAPPAMAVENASEKSSRASENAMSSPLKMPASGFSAATSQPDMEKGSLQIHSPPVSEKLSFDALFWLKWIAIAALGFAVLKPLSINLDDNNKIFQFVPILFASLVGLVSVVQWRVFRDHLRSWWIPANVAGGIILGGLNTYLYYEQGWWGMDVLFNVLMVINLILGTTLIRRAPEKPNDPSPPLSTGSVSIFTDTDPRRNLFVMLLSVFLIFYGFVALMNAFNDLGVLSTSGWIKNTSWTVYGIASLLVGISFFILNKEIPRNSGFVTLAIFLLVNGIVVELFAFNSDLSEYLFNISGTMALLSFVFFVSQRETWKHLRWILLSGYLFFVGLVYFGIDVFHGIYTFSIITALFALLAGVSFFLRK